MNQIGRLDTDKNSIRITIEYPDRPNRYVLLAREVTLELEQEIVPASLDMLKIRNTGITKLIARGELIAVEPKE